MNIEDALCKWTPGRAPFDPVVLGHDTMTAHTDGFLKTFDRDRIPDILAIMETKLASRKKLCVFWQESVDMMAWIMHNAIEGHQKCRSTIRCVESYDAIAVCYTNKF